MNENVNPSSDAPTPAPTIIPPTVGRVVWYYEHGAAAPQAAIVAYVHSDRCVNLGVFDPNGHVVGRTSVPLVQEGDAAPERGSYCRWMPYQLGQARKAGGAA